MPGWMPATALLARKYSLGPLAAEPPAAYSEMERRNRHMGDFHQDGAVTTLHRLNTGNVNALERELSMFSQQRKIALVLPCLFSEFRGPALPRILGELERVSYVDTVVLSL